MKTLLYDVSARVWLCMLIALSLVEAAIHEAVTLLHRWRHS